MCTHCRIWLCGDVTWHGSVAGCAALGVLRDVFRVRVSNVVWAPTCPANVGHINAIFFPSSGYYFSYEVCYICLTLFSFFRRIQVTSKPQMIDEVDRRLIQLEMEKLSLRKETRADALKRIEQIDDEMAELQEKQVICFIFVFWDASVLL